MLRLQLPTLNLPEQQSTKAIFSAGLRAEVEAGENEIRDLLSVKIQQQLRGLCSWKKGDSLTVLRRQPQGCRNVTGQMGWKELLSETLGALYGQISLLFQNNN